MGQFGFRLLRVKRTPSSIKNRILLLLWLNLATIYTLISHVVSEIS